MFAVLFGPWDYVYGDVIASPQKVFEPNASTEDVSHLDDDFFAKVFKCAVVMLSGPKTFLPGRLRISVPVFVGENMIVFMYCTRS